MNLRDLIYSSQQSQVDYFDQIDDQDGYEGLRSNQSQSNHSFSAGNDDLNYYSNTDYFPDISFNSSKKVEKRRDSYYDNNQHYENLLSQLTDTSRVDFEDRYRVDSEDSDEDDQRKQKSRPMISA
jgi:hypothetical protein